MKYKLCPECDCPLLPAGAEKKPDEYDHANGCGYVLSQVYRKLISVGQLLSTWGVRLACRADPLTEDERQRLQLCAESWDKELDKVRHREWELVNAQRQGGGTPMEKEAVAAEAKTESPRVASTPCRKERRAKRKPVTGE